MVDKVGMCINHVNNLLTVKCDYGVAIDTV